MNGQPLSIDLPDALIEAVAERVLERLSERQAPQNGDGWLRGAPEIADYIGAPASRVYALHSAARLPCVQKDGSALIARRGDLDAWLQAGGARRP